MNTLISFEINGAEPEALEGMKGFLQNSPRFDLRITAVYGSDKHKCIREKILRFLANYENITIKDIGPLIYVYKYPVT